MVFRLWLILAVVLGLTGCADHLKTKEKVQQAILDRLKQHSGLDLDSLDVTTTDVNFEKNKAYATVAFHPKGDPAVNSGMSMKYTLEERGDKWVVTSVNGSHGGSMGSPHGGMGGTDQLPPGHPSLSGGPEAQK